MHKSRSGSRHINFPDKKEESRYNKSSINPNTSVFEQEKPEKINSSIFGGSAQDMLKFSGGLQSSKNNDYQILDTFRKTNDNYFITLLKTWRKKAKENPPR